MDGWYGKNTAKAVEELQEKYGLPKTGKLDKRTFL
ncbi:peptidoglycan-binding domain-containing protein [Caloranaerobacter sp. DY30410]